MYTTLFNAFTDALRELDEGDVDAARARLMKGQCDAEDIYTDWEDGEE